MKTTKQKNFDCLEMKREIQAKTYEKIKDMTTEELVAYFNAAPSIFDWSNSPVLHIPSRKKAAVA